MRKKTHNFKPGDLVKDRNGDYGIVTRVNEIEIIVGWQDVECAFDTYPDQVEFVCHIPLAEMIDQNRVKASDVREKRQQKELNRLVRSLEKLK